MFAGNGFSRSFSIGKNNREEGDQEVAATVKMAEEGVEEESHTTPRSIVASKELSMPTMTTAIVEELNFQIAIQHQKKNIEIISLM